MSEHEVPGASEGEARRWFERLLQEAYSAGAADVHLVPEATPRLRIDGRLEPRGDPVPADRLEALARELFGEAGLARQRQEGFATRSLRLDLRGRIEGPGTRGDAPLSRPAGSGGLFGRATLASTCGRFSISFRMGVGLGAGTLPLEALRLPSVVLDELLAHDHGLILVAGSHESGKTTTLLALTRWIVDHQPVHVCTVEDPLVQLLAPGVALLQQREVGTDVPDVRTGIAAALGQDLDVLVVNEVPDLESLMGLLHAAETGHLVLAQVHARSPGEALERLIEAAPEGLETSVRRSLAETLRGVIWQRLLPRQPRGRVAAHEVLVADEALRATLLGGGRLADPRGAPSSVSLGSQLEALEREGLIAPEVAAEARREARGR